MVLLAERLPALYGPEVTPAVHALTGALAAGYAATLRDRTLDEQEAIRRAVLVARQHTEQALHASEARFRAMFHEAAIGIGLGDMKGRILEVNPAMTRMFGHTADEFRALTVGELAHPDDAPAVWRLYERLLRGELDNFRLEKRFFRRDGEVIVGHLTLSLVRDEEGKPSYQLAMLEDVSERHRLQQHLTYQAYHDPLTTLANRARFTERLERVFADAGPHSTRRVGVCYLDLDGFKTINDSLGHHVGDLMLQEVARRLGACAGEGELVARTGGDEFVVLVEDSQGVDRLVGLADRVLAALAPPLRLAGQELAVGASIGVVEQAVTDTTASELMRAADITLYTAKAEGRGRWAVHDPDRDEAETARFTLSAALPMAVAHDEFFVLYQPLVSLSDHRVRGVEALVRWQHPRLGVLSPALFIGPAEETGVIVPLGRSVLETACRDARDWHAEFGSAAPFVSVNVAPRQLHEPGLVAEVAALLDRTGLPPDRLQVELTERALTTDEGAPAQGPRRAARDGRPDRRRRLRHRLLEPLLPAQTARRRDQARRVVRRGAAGGGALRRGRRADRGDAGRPRSRAGPDGDRRGRRDRGAGRAAARARVRRGPGLAVRARAARRGRRHDAAARGAAGRTDHRLTVEAGRAESGIASPTARGAPPGRSGRVGLAAARLVASPSTRSRPGGPSRT